MASHRDHKNSAKIFEFVLLNTFSMMGFVSAIEPLRVANQILGRHAYQWRVVSEDGADIQASNGMLCESEGCLNDQERADVTILCVGFDLSPKHPKRLCAFLQKRFRQGCAVGGIDMGSLFLARARLLDGRRCTIHWEGAPALQEEFPQLDITQAFYEIEDRIFTGSGGMSSCDLILALIAREQTETVIYSIANQLQLDRLRTEAALQSAGSLHLSASAPATLRKAVLLLSKNAETPICPKDLAEQVGASRKTLERLFLKHTGMTPSKYCKTQRLERARDLLLHSNLTITEIALATGFKSASYFSFCFSRHFGEPPSSQRSETRV